MTHPIRDADHALRAGMLLGHLLSCGVDAVPVVDGENYTAEAVVTLPGETDVTVHILVEPEVEQ